MGCCGENFTVSLKLNSILRRAMKSAEAVGLTLRVNKVVATDEPPFSRVAISQMMPDGTFAKNESYATIINAAIGNATDIRFVAGDCILEFFEGSEITEVKAEKKAKKVAVTEMQPDAETPENIY